MRLVALADNKEDFGRITDADAVVGEITTDGTEFVLFTGAVLGIVGSLVYVAVRRWLPARAGFRQAMFAAIVLGPGLVLTIDGNQGDFVFLDTVTSILSFSVVIVLYALALPLVVERFAPRAVGRSHVGRAVIGSVLIIAVAAGTSAVIHAFEYADGSRLPG
jgi:hypothetical protein